MTLFRFDILLLLLCQFWSNVHWQSFDRRSLARALSLCLPPLSITLFNFNARLMRSPAIKSRSAVRQKCAQKSFELFVCVTFIVDRLRCCCFYYIALVGAKKAKATVNNANTGAEFTFCYSEQWGEKCKIVLKKRVFIFCRNILIKIQNININISETNKLSLNYSNK